MELLPVLPVLAVGLLLAFANGANDNFKGVATLYGSGTASYRVTLAWATATTLAGSLAALVLARGLLAAFSGRGLVPAEVAADPGFPLAVALAAGGTVLLATRLGFPVSTTHALIGGLVGAGLVAAPGRVDPATLGSGFLLPLLTSPLAAGVLALGLYPPLTALRRRLGIDRETCVCVGRQVMAVLPPGADPAPALRAAEAATVGVGTRAACRERYRGRLLGVSAGAAADAAHFASAGLVGFARGLNDTPKIAALLLAGGAVGPGPATVGAAAAIALGGVLAARRVAETLAHRVTGMDPGPGLLGNAVTALLVVGASRLGLPVSTTHVACGALFGIGAVTGRARWGTIGRILLAWGITLPLAAVLGAAARGALGG